VRAISAAMTGWASRVRPSQQHARKAEHGRAEAHAFRRAGAFADDVVAMLQRGEKIGQAAFRDAERARDLAMGHRLRPRGEEFQHIQGPGGGLDQDAAPLAV
jgi:hypothetical protein